MEGSRKQINTQSCLSFGPSSALRQKSRIIVRKDWFAMRNTIMLALLALSILFVGCGHKTFHQGSMPEPGAYMIHFTELDADGDDTVTGEEFKQRFPDST